jgi:hypothetical protein
MIDYSSLVSCHLCGSVEIEKKRGNPPLIRKNLPGWGTRSGQVDSEVDLDHLVYRCTVLKVQ